MERTELKFFGTNRSKNVEKGREKNVSIELLVSGLDSSAIFSGEPFVSKSKESLARILTITLVRCNDELNGN